MSGHKTFGFASRCINIFPWRTTVVDALVSLLQIHCRWSLRKTSSSTCQVNIKIGVNMKKWCILQSKIKSGATDEYRREVCKILQAACDYALAAEPNGPSCDDIVLTSSAWKTAVENHLHCSMHTDKAACAWKLLHQPSEASNGTMSTSPHEKWQLKLETT